jgi:hypothetical protein
MSKVAGLWGGSRIQRAGGPWEGRYENELHGKEETIGMTGAKLDLGMGHEKVLD